MDDSIRVNLLVENLTKGDTMHFVPSKMPNERDEFESEKTSLNPLLTTIQRKHLPLKTFLMDLFRKVDTDHSTGEEISSETKNYRRILKMWLRKIFVIVICLTTLAVMLFIALPKHKESFSCLLSSSSSDRVKNGCGNISNDQGDIFCEQESLEFFEQNLQIEYAEFQLKEWCRLLGKFPLAMQLAAAAMNQGKIELESYITLTEFMTNIVDAELDDYEKAINAGVIISTELIASEEYGAVAKDILRVFGYIRPDDIPIGFFSRVLKNKISHVDKGIELLVKYSLISKQVKRIYEVSFGTIEESEVSMQRLVQQVVRHRGRNTEKDTLRKILHSSGLLDYKLIPFTKYADEELRKEFPEVKAELLDQNLLLRLVKEKRFEESVELAKFIDQEINTNTTKFNYAMCLEMNGQLEDEINILEELYKQNIKDKTYYNRYSLEMGLLKLEVDLTKELVGGHLLASHWKMDNKERTQEILQERKSFKMIGSDEMVLTLLRILNSNLIHSNYSLKNVRSMFKLVLGGDTKRIELENCSVELSLPLPNDLQELVVNKMHFKNGNGKDANMTDVSEWLPKKLTRLEMSCDNLNIILSLEFISSIENIYLSKCSLSLDSKFRISPRELKLQKVIFVENGQELSNVTVVNDFIDFQRMKQLELLSNAKKNLSIDLSEESANMEYVHLDGVNVLNLKSADCNGIVNIQIAKIENCLLDLSTLPSSLQILSLNTEVFVGGEIDLPNLRYLVLEDKSVSLFSHFRDLQLTYLFLNKVQEVNVDLLPPSTQIIRIGRHYGRATRLLGGIIHVDKLILEDFPLNEVEEMLPHFQPKRLVLSKSNPGYKPSDLIQVPRRKMMPIAIGIVDWRKEEFKNSNLSKQVDRQSKYYLFHEGTGKAIQEKEFPEELYN